jgi:hypothetical protein
MDRLAPGWRDLLGGAPDVLEVVGDRVEREAWVLRARKVLGRPKRSRLAHAFLWECSYKRLKLAQLLGQLGAFLFLTWPPRNSPQRLGACARSAGSIDQYHTCGQGHPCLNTPQDTPY